jgi:hypothetical protein
MKRVSRVPKRLGNKAVDDLWAAARTLRKAVRSVARLSDAVRKTAKPKVPRATREI